ncbi:MAG: DUF2071 domain-containing protein [Blastocatellia bacterium]|nr:DUF2071 domain-containing protein [Blastocatellia bacterium]
MSGGIFLTAEWRHLAMLNYEIEPDLLRPYVPAGTELDSWDGKYFVSMVGFRFLRTKVLGLPIPFHQNFEEVNLRFYVRRKAEDGWRRGVVFRKEIVPRAAVAFVARVIYNEKYVALPMRHQVDLENGSLKSEGAVEYGWRWKGRWNHLRVETKGTPQPLVTGSEEEFITEHYWGYSAQRNGRSVEYRVEHPRWMVWQSAKASLDCDSAALYGERFVDCLSAAPHSAFLAEGSQVIVRKGEKI